MCLVRQTLLGVGLVGLIGVASAGFERSVNRERFRERMNALRVSQLEGTGRVHGLTFKSEEVSKGSRHSRFLASQPRLSPSGGIFPQTKAIEVSTQARHGAVHYTLDGSLPDQSSPILPDMLIIQEPTTVRMRTYSPGRLPSQMASHTYVVGMALTLPVLNLSVDPANLYNARSGLMTRSLSPAADAARVEADVEYFGSHAGSQNVQFAADVKLHGGWSRRRDKKSLRIYVKSTALASLTPVHPLAAPSGEKSHVVILRCGGNNHRWRTADELFDLIYLDAGRVSVSGHPKIVSDFTPYHQFVNGKYWGIYNLRRRIDSAFLRQRLGGAAYDIVKVRPGGTQAASGSKADWSALQRKLEEAGKGSSASMHERIVREVDVDSFTDYVLLNIYASNQDWVFNNVVAYRERAPGEKWHFQPWDDDQTFGWINPAFNDGSPFCGAQRNDLETTLDYPPGPDGHPHMVSLLLRELLKSPQYRLAFAIRLHDLLNTVLRPKRIDQWIDLLLAAVAEDVHFDLERWSTPRQHYERAIAEMRRFARERPQVLSEYTRRVLGLGESVELEIDVEPQSGGKVQVSTVLPVSYPWSGQYFTDAVLTLTPHPAKGYRFQGWTTGGPPAKVVTLRSSQRHRAIFTRDIKDAGER